MATDDARINDRIRAREVLLIGADGDAARGEATARRRSRSPGSRSSISSRSRPTPIRRSAGSWTTASTSTSRISGARNRGKQGDERRHQGDEVPPEDRRRTTTTTKMKHVERFLGEGSKVKLTIMFRGREMAHPELGRKILEQVAERRRRDRDRRVVTHARTAAT